MQVACGPGHMVFSWGTGGCIVSDRHDLISRSTMWSSRIVQTDGEHPSEQRRESYGVGSPSH